MRVLIGQDNNIVMTTILCDYICAEFCQEVGDHQMPHVAPIILPQLLQVIAQPQVGYPYAVDCTIRVFNVGIYCIRTNFLRM